MTQHDQQFGYPEPYPQVVQQSQPVQSQPVLSQPVLSQPVLSQPVLSQPVQSQPHRRTAVIAGLVALALIAAGAFFFIRAQTETVNSGPTLIATDGIVSNADTFLATLDQTWQAETATLTAQQATSSADARCYYLLDSNEATTSKAACGPLRRFGTEAGMVWDTYSLFKLPDLSEDADKGTWVYEQATPALQGVARPAGTFYRPDGAEPPADADALEPPPMPQAPANLLSPFNVDAAPTVNNLTIDPDQATLIAPGLQLTLTQVGEAATVAPEDFAGTAAPTLPDQQYEAADGRRLLVFTVEAHWGWPAAEYSVAEAGEFGTSKNMAPPAVISFINDGVRTDITGEFGSQPYADDITRTFVASVSTASGDPAQLAVSVSGHEQTITVGTATRDPDPTTDLYYNENRVTAVNATMPAFSIDYNYYGEQTVAYSATASTVSFSPFDPRKGWAPEGQMWVSVIVSDELRRNGYVPGSIAIDYAGWKITADGTEYAAVYQTLEGNNDGVFVFQVPDAVSAVDGSFVTTATVTTTDPDPLVLTSPALTFSAGPS